MTIHASGLSLALKWDQSISEVSYVERGRSHSGLSADATRKRSSAQMRTGSGPVVDERIFVSATNIWVRSLARIGVHCAVPLRWKQGSYTWVGRLASGIPRARGIPTGRHMAHRREIR